MSQSADVAAGTNATAVEQNKLRADAIKRDTVFAWEVEDAVAVLDDQGGHYVVPFDCTIYEVYGKVDSGTCVIRLQKNGSDIKAGMTITSSGDSFTSSFSITALSKGDKLSLDVTGSSSGSGLLANLYVTRNL